MKKNNKEQKVLTQVEHEILSALHCLSKDESEAMSGYEDFEAKYGMYLTKTELANIREFISEEKKHLKKINKMIEKRDGIKPEENHHEVAHQVAPVTPTVVPKKPPKKISEKT